MKQLGLSLWAALLAGAAWGHGGIDHGAEETHGRVPAPSLELAPRAVAVSEELELVAILEDGRLILYVDRYASNEPLADARVEVEAVGLSATAAPLAPGVYGLPAPALAVAGRHALAISVQTDEVADLLSAYLEVPGAAAPAHVHSWDEWLVWGAAGGLLLVGGGLVWRRRRRRHHRA